MQHSVNFIEYESDFIMLIENIILTVLQKTDEKGPSKDEGGKEKEKKRKREYVRVRTH